MNHDGNSSITMLSMLVIIGKLITNMTILPPKSTLSPKPAFPVSAHMLAENSAKYPIPTILKTIDKIDAFIPVFDATRLISDMAEERDDKIIIIIMTPPTSDISMAKSLRTGLTISVAMQVTRPTAMILSNNSMPPPFFLAVNQSRTLIE